jgi:diketogulonate reductase-like aldo/keto reductase
MILLIRYICPLKTTPYSSIFPLLTTTIAMSVESFTLLDNTTIPWLAWGNGSGKARASALESGLHALNSGITHIDTAQCYYDAGGKNGDNELTVNEVLQKWGKPKSSIYITSKSLPQ